MPLLKLVFPAHARNAYRPKQVSCYLNSNGGPVLVAYGTTCVEGGTVCAPNDCPGNSAPPFE